MKTLDFVGVRGSQSAARLLASDAKRPINVTPDLGWLFPRLLAERIPIPHPANGQPYLAVQSLGFSDVEAAAVALSRISRSTGLQVVLLPLTRCWQDALPLGALHRASRGEFFLVEDGIPDLDKLAILGGVNRTGFAGGSQP
jgi:hypothetical protein